MFKKTTAYILFFTLLSCGGEKAYELPAGIITKEDLIPVIVDLQILESHFQRNFSRLDLYRDALDSSSYYIFEEHGTSKELYTTSLNYYAGMPDTLYTIYEAALDTVNFRLNQAN